MNRTGRLQGMTAGAAAGATLALVAALLLPACGRRIDNSNIDVVNQRFEKSEDLLKKGVRDAGISPKEVESILGPPQRVETTKLPLETQKKEVDVVRYYYQQDGQTLELHFFDNKLISKIPHVEGKPAAPAAATPAENKP